MEKIIMLVEDNPDDEELTLRALRKANIANEVFVARDGTEALDFLFSTGRYSERRPLPMPAVVLLDLKLPKLNGIDVLKSYQSGANSYVRKPVEFSSFANAVTQLGMYWMLLNQVPPSRA